MNKHVTHDPSERNTSCLQDDGKSDLTICRAIVVRKAIDQFVGAGVAEFTANQTLQIRVVRLQALGARGEFGVVPDQAVACRLQLSPMMPQKRQITRPEGCSDATDYQQHQDGAEN
jgi:hypothetical protein